MRRLSLWPGVLGLGLLALGMQGLAGLPGAVAAPPSGVSASLEPARASVPVGDRFTVRSVIRNDGSTATTPLLAHLDIVSLRSDVYVDAEDWSALRTRHLAPLAPGQSASVDWSVRAVSAGGFGLHVVVLHVVGPGAGALAVSTPTYAEVTARRTLNPGGSLGVVLGVPAVVAAGALAARLRRRTRG